MDYWVSQGVSRLRAHPLSKGAFLLALLVGTVLALVPSSGGGIPHLDKLMHLTAFFNLALLLDLASLRPFWRWKLPFLLGYGATVEIMQAFVPWRSFSIADFIADTAGVLLYWAVWRWWLHRHLPHPHA